ncbi:TIR domain-containing protein [Streptomyces sp. DR7-3]|uniref:TIR domain-containing protein n=1 Tax=Streptomyces malaysiensis TaxID=92644 RepID=UPI0020446E68|nr:TIR domain-containing protein [Streptomyces sp. DR7-3]MCM3808320.1 TIR domain-containing protein [Streptomyces sp. DR7-3]
MARRTFFSFHYERDVWRSAVVRKSAALKTDIAPEFIDASLWEESKLKGDDALRKLIDDALYGTTVTAVLIGAETHKRRWVKYEISQSIARGNGLFGIYIHNIRDQYGNKDTNGTNPLDPQYATYDWVNDDGYNNLSKWVEAAYDQR